MTGDKSQDTPKFTSIAKQHSRRRAARIACVQAFYQMEISGGDPDAVVSQFLLHRLQDNFDGIVLGELDREFFKDLTVGAYEVRDDLENMIAAVLDESWPVDRLEKLLRIILQLGVYELAYYHDIPSKVIIDEYVEITYNFFHGSEPGMVNGLLDNLARQLRLEEFE